MTQFSCRKTPTRNQPNYMFIGIKIDTQIHQHTHRCYRHNKRFESLYAKQLFSWEVDGGRISTFMFPISK